MTLFADPEDPSVGSRGREEIPGSPVNRYYDPSTGQFLSRDPAVPVTREAYGYVSDNPLNGTDRTGLSVDLPGGMCLRSVMEVVRGDNADCNSIAHQHPALTPVLGAVAAVAALPAVIAVATYGAVAVGTELAATYALAGGGLAGTAAALGEAGIFTLAGSALASALAIPIGIAVDLYESARHCGSTLGQRLIESGVAGTGGGSGPQDPVLSPAPPAPLYPYPASPPPAQSMP